MKREYAESTAKAYYVVIHFDNCDVFVATEETVAVLRTQFRGAKLMHTVADAIGLRNSLPEELKNQACIEYLDFQKRRIVKHRL